MKDLNNLSPTNNLEPTTIMRTTTHSTMFTIIANIKIVTSDLVVSDETIRGLPENCAFSLKNVAIIGKREIQARRQMHISNIDHDEVGGIEPLIEPIMLI